MNFIKKLIIIALVGTMGLVALGIIMGLGEEDTEVQREEAQSTREIIQPVEKDKPSSGRDSFKEAYLESCADEDVTMSYCECTYDYFIDTYGYEGFVDLAVDYSESGIIGEEMVDAVLECSHLL